MIYAKSDVVSCLNATATSAQSVLGGWYVPSYLDTALYERLRRKWDGYLVQISMTKS